jgi:hypothetical protein
MGGHPVPRFSLQPESVPERETNARQMLAEFNGAAKSNEIFLCIIHLANCEKTT